jgi:predicted ATPase
VRTGEIAGELAVHFEEGRDYPAAVRHRIRAAENALGRSAHGEALGHVQQALDVLDRALVGGERDEAELRVHLVEAAAYSAAKGFGAPEVESAYRRASVLSTTVGDEALRTSVLCGLWSLAMVHADLATASELAAELDRLAEASADTGMRLLAHNVCGETYVISGAGLAAAAERAEQARALHDPTAHRALALLHGEDPGVICRLYGAKAAWLLGRPSLARSRAHEALGLARELGYPAAITEALGQASIVHQLCGDVDTVRRLTEELDRVSVEYDVGQWVPVGRVLNGWARSRAGETERAVALIRSASDEWVASGIELNRPYHCGLLADAIAASGDASGALDVVDEGLAGARATGNRWYEAELVRLGGELLLRRHHLRSTSAEDAEARFGEAVAISQSQQARSFELRAATSLARLWASRGEPERGRRILAGVYELFDEGHDTEDLARARRALAELL